VLELDLSEKGEVAGARVVKPAGEAFDEAARAAARKLRFSPAEIDGKPAAVTIEYRFKFDAGPPLPDPPPSGGRKGRGEAGGVLRGVALERGTREPLAGASVGAGEGKSTVTDRDGRFELVGIGSGIVKVVVSDPAHHRFETQETLEEGKAVEVKSYLRRKATDAYAAVVVGEREQKEVTSADHLR
jgi:TonB family protein